MTLNLLAAGAGRPVLVLPSFGLDAAAMAASVEPAFAPVAGWRRLYADLPGTGASAPGEPASDAVLDELAATVESVLPGQRVPVAGWSYGGYLAAALARRRPGQVSGLLLVCTATRIRPADRDLGGTLPSVPEPGWLDRVPENLREHLAEAVGRQTAEVADRIVAALARRGPLAGSYLAQLRETGFALADDGAPTVCAGPVSVLAGRRDRVAGFRALFGALDGYDQGDYLALAEAGHYLPLEEPARFAAATAAWLDACRHQLDATGT